MPRRVRKGERILKPTELAWLAGFIDTDGHIGVRRMGTGNFALQLVIGGTHKPSIETCQHMMNSGLYQDNIGSQTHKEGWRTTLSGTRAKGLLERVFPYMVTKKRQAAIALTFPVGNGGHHHPGHPLLKVLQNECCKAMSKLNKKGPSNA